jgi:putative NADH-flavin reductase
MHLAVLGATGRTGRLVVEAARKRGHVVTALTRGTPPADQETLKWVRGDIDSRRALLETVERQDAVISALGPTKADLHVCSAATARLIDLGVTRLVVISGAAVDIPGDNKDLIGRAVSNLVRMLSPAVFADKQQEISLLLNSDIDWTAIRAPRLTNKTSDRPIQVRLDRSPGTVIDRGTLARFCVDVAEGDLYARQAPFVAN